MHIPKAIALTFTGRNLRFDSDSNSEMYCSEIKMKALVFVALLLAGGAAFYYMGGMEKFGLTGPKNLPETITPPNATFMGNEYTNPYSE